MAGENPNAGNQYDSPNQEVVRADGSGPERNPPNFELTGTVDGLTVSVTVPAEAPNTAYEVWWGDGSEPDAWSTVNEPATHTYAAPGNYLVTADPLGEDVTQDSAWVTVGMPQPTQLDDAEIDTAFDPGDHSVAEVKAYIESLDDAAEIERIAAAESAGENRSTLTTWFDSRLDESE